MRQYKGMLALLGATLFGFNIKAGKVGRKYPTSWKPVFTGTQLKNIRAAETKREREALVKEYRAAQYEIDQPLY